MFTLQNVIRTTIMRYTRTTSGPRYIKSTFVFICEIQKAILCMFLIFANERNIFSGLKIILQTILKEPYNTMKICLIALIYTIQNNFNQIAISKMDIAHFTVDTI